MTIAYYDANSDRYFEETVGADLSDLRSRFLAYVPAGGRILDAGCGAGRDARAFNRAGYDVTAFDGSRSMARRASEYSGLQALHLTFDAVGWHREFDGVWACASLLHLKRDVLPEAVRKLAMTLKPGGVFFASFKYGEHEREVEGRHFTDLKEYSLKNLFSAARLRILEVWVSQDSRTLHGRQLWVNCIGRASRSFDR